MPVPLPEQDRDKWNRAGIEEGLQVLASIPGREQPGPYRIHAEIAACHADLLRRLDRSAEAAPAYREAIDQAATEPERHFLERRLAEITWHS